MTFLVYYHRILYICNSKPPIRVTIKVTLSVSIGKIANISPITKKFFNKMQKKIIKCIVVPKGTVDEICKELDCTKMTVYRALRLESASELADKIRELAKAKGGVVTTKPLFKPTIVV